MEKKLFVMTYLGLGSVADIRRRKISLVFTALFGIIGMAIMLYKRELAKGAPSFLIGLLLLGLCLISGEALGRGDALTVLALGTVLTWQELLKTLSYALMLCSITALVLLVCFKKSRKTELPFLPFLLLGYVGGLLL